MQTIPAKKHQPKRSVANHRPSPKFYGIIVPIVTPLDSEGNIDLSALENLLARISTPGITGVFVLGTTGEAPSLSLESRIELIRHTCKLMNGKLPVLVGITDPAFPTSIRLAKVAEDAGASAVVAAPPFYFSISQDELLAYYNSLASQINLPLFLYNMPTLTKLVIAPSTLRKLTFNEKICGVKDSSGSLKYISTLTGLKKQRPDWSILVGPEHLLTRALQKGVDGGVNGGAQILPEVFGSLYLAHKNGDKRGVRQLARKIKVLQEIYGRNPDSASVIKAIKSALESLGICSAKVAPPLQDPDTQTKQRVRSVLNKLGLLRL